MGKADITVVFYGLSKASASGLDSEAIHQAVRRTRRRSRKFTLTVVAMKDMSLLVPFDGSQLATKALEKASTFGDLLDESVVVLTVIPDDPEYARERGWITQGEPFDSDAIATGMETRAREVAPEATFRVEEVQSDEPTATATTNVVREIRRVAAEIGTSVVFIGSENAGSVISPQSSVGSPVANDQRYDVYVVRHLESGEHESVSDLDSTVD
ncbi:UspA domain-containing protein [Natronobacterium gregoryi SP2]|uniref:UspA domain-containing protein n=3 Tax=Natronobacterium gregoryi TaxID=44930 RepID=L9YGJ6_NATGS|nr:UspA domain-containing protein [Natronobacterium gregoryi SP2]